MTITPAPAAIRSPAGQPGADRRRPGLAAARRLDGGRLVIVPAAAALLLLDALALIRGGALSPGRLVGAALVCAFYSLVIWCYLRRGPARASSGSVAGSAAAITATLLPFALPLLAGAPPAHWLRLSADLLIVVGTCWSLWSLRWLGRNLSVLAQARGLAEDGPYRLVRHPLYLGEIVATLGVALTAGSLAAIAAWLCLVALQAYRARQEERLLLAAIPGYAAYRSRTAALIPRVF